MGEIRVQGITGEPRNNTTRREGSKRRQREKGTSRSCQRASAEPTGSSVQAPVRKSRQFPGRGRRAPCEPFPPTVLLPGKGTPQAGRGPESGMVAPVCALVPLPLSDHVTTAACHQPSQQGQPLSLRMLGGEAPY